MEEDENYDAPVLSGVDCSTVRISDEDDGRFYQIDDRDHFD